MLGALSSIGLLTVGVWSIWATSLSFFISLPGITRVLDSGPETAEPVSSEGTNGAAAWGWGSGWD